MFTKITIALATVLMLGAGSAALAGDVNDDVSASQAERDWNDYLGLSQKHMGKGGTTYGTFGSQQDNLFQPGKKNRNR
jgi:hypothetical protein